MGEVGRWDPVAARALFGRFAEVRARPRPFRRSEDDAYVRLLGENVRFNDRLAVKLAWRQHGPHIDRLGRSEVLATARLALVLAVRTFDPAKGNLSSWCALKLRAELQRAERLEPVVKGPPKKRAPDVVYLEEDEHLASTMSEEVRCQLRHQVRGRIFISERDGERIREASGVSRATIHRYTAGWGVHPTNEKRIVAAMEQLKIPRIEKRIERRARRAVGASDVAA